jgi:hypothetical protein
MLDGERESVVLLPRIEIAVAPSAELRGARSA